MFASTPQAAGSWRLRLRPRAEPDVLIGLNSRIVPVEAIRPGRVQSTLGVCLRTARRRTFTITILRKAMTMRHAVTLYVSSVLGSGILVLPGLAARLAGPGSLLAWAVLSLASYPFAYTFASLSSRNPESGGVYAFAREAFGRHAAAIAGWLFGLWYIAGAPAVTLIAASYLGYAFPLSRLEIHLVACLVIVVPYVINLRGIVFSSRVQMGIVAAIITMLVLAVGFSISSVRKLFTVHSQWPAPGRHRRGPDLLLLPRL